MAEEISYRDTNQQLEQAEPEARVHSQGGEYFGDIASRVIARRAFLKGGAVATAATLTIAPGTAAAFGGGPWWRRGDEGLQFEAIPDEFARDNADILVPMNYEAQVLLKWGAPLFPGAPEFDYLNQTREAQEQQVGFNHDLVLFYPLPYFVKGHIWRRGRLNYRTDRLLGILYPIIKDKPTRNALVCINHEYTTGSAMFPSYDSSAPSKDQVEVEIAAHGATIAELEIQHDGSWEFVKHSPFNQRISGYTEIDISGPLAGYEALKTADDPTGRKVIGMFNNCAGGKTPWGTILTCEENFDQYFAHYSEVSEENRKRSDRIAAPGGESGRKWERYDERFDLRVDGNQYNKYGYVVEIDPYDPSSKPVKRTALGRFKHEGAQGVETKDGRVALYSGDDARFEYVYKFVTKHKYNRLYRSANKNLLDEGVLYVARFDDKNPEEDAQNMGTGVWLPLVWEEGNALHQAGFQNQQEVLLNTRGAADVLGATPMDRPEDIDISPVTGKVYVALTNNSRRTGDNPDATRDAQGREVSSWWNAANPRLDNENGHVVEIVEKGGDNGALKFEWNIFILCGEPGQPDTAFGNVKDPVAAGVSTISDPDNVAFDSEGNLWIATDGMPGGVYYESDGSTPSGGTYNDGVFAVPTEGINRGLLKRFFAGVPGSEVCGPEFSGDNRTFFCAIQHPDAWPLGEEVAKPALVAVRHRWRKKIGK